MPLAGVKGTPEQEDWLKRAREARKSGLWAGTSVICPVHLRPMSMGVANIEPCGCDCADQDGTAATHGLPDAWFAPQNSGGKAP